MSDRGSETYNTYHQALKTAMFYPCRVGSSLLIGKLKGYDVRVVEVSVVVKALLIPTGCAAGRKSFTRPPFASRKGDRVKLLLPAAQPVGMIRALTTTETPSTRIPYPLNFPIKRELPTLHR